LYGSSCAKPTVTTSAPASSAAMTLADVSAAVERVSTPPVFALRTISGVSATRVER
jgi:hypothetical protein